MMSLLVRIGLAYSSTQELKNSRIQEEPAGSRRGPYRSILPF
jgi:hypothetical protein